MTPAPAGVANLSFGNAGRPWPERPTFGGDVADTGMDNANRGLPLLFREVLGGGIGAEAIVGAGAVDMLKIYYLPICNNQNKGLEALQSSYDLFLGQSGK